MINLTLNRYISTMLFIFVITAANCFAKGICAENFVLVNKNLLVRSLVDYGYSKQVAVRIAADLPNLAEKIVKMPRSQGRAITLYKGIGKPPNKITLDLSFYQKIEFWLSLDLDIATSFARPEKGQVGTILELQVPFFLFTSADPSVKDPLELVNRGLYDGTLSIYDVPNLQPFITRIGVTDINDVNWLELTEAEQAGLFKAHFNYKKYFQ